MTDLLTDGQSKMQDIGMDVVFQDWREMNKWVVITMVNVIIITSVPNGNI